MRHRLAEHGRLGLDAADAPAEHAQAVDHRGVRVGADERVGVGRAPSPARIDDAGQVLDVDLVDDAGARRHDLEVVERGLAPAQELVALAVALVLELDVALEGVGRAEQVGDDGVVDDQLGRRERVDLASASPPRSATASRMVARSTMQGTPVKSCMTTRAGRELDLGVGLGRRVPAGRAPRIWSAVTFAPSSVRSRFSSSTLRLNGQPLARPRPRRAGRSRRWCRRPSRVPAGPEAVDAAGLFAHACPPWWPGPVVGARPGALVGPCVRAVRVWADRGVVVRRPVDPRVRDRPRGGRPSTVPRRLAAWPADASRRPYRRRRSRPSGSLAHGHR